MKCRNLKILLSIMFCMLMLMPSTILKADELSNTDGIEVSTEEEEKGIFTTAYEVTVEKTAIRAGKGTKYAIIKIVYKDDVVKVYSIKDGWAKVKVADKTGYIASKNIKKKK